jgi:hypothetical protein
MVLEAPQVAARAYFDGYTPHLGRLHMANHRNFVPFSSQVVVFLQIG